MRMQGGGFSKEERRLTLMAAMLLPLRAAKAPLKGSKTQPLTSHLLLHGIKWRTSDADCVEVAHREAGTLLDAFHQLQVCLLLSRKIKEPADFAAGSLPPAPGWPPLDHAK